MAGHWSSKPGMRVRVSPSAPRSGHPFPGVSRRGGGCCRKANVQPTNWECGLKVGRLFREQDIKGVRFPPFPPVSLDWSSGMTLARQAGSAGSITAYRTKDNGYVQPGRSYNRAMPYSDLEKQRDYQRRWMAERRAQWLAVNGPCLQCGSWISLEVHHRDKHLKVSHNVWSWSKSRRDAELAKCDVLCHEHHRVETKKQRPWTHGDSGYHRGGCRCDVCRAGHRAHLALRKR
jgi:hypothetical protein